MTNPLAQDLGGVVRLLEKATPGPWECGAGNAYEPQTTVYCDDALGSAVATCAHSMTALIPSEQERANAAAIAACVNFLRAHSAEIAEALSPLPEGSLRFIAKRNLRRLIEIGSADKELMLNCLEELS